MRGPVTSSRARRNPPPRPGRCARGRGRGHVRRPAQGQAGQPRPPGRFTNRKLYPGLRCPNGPPHLKSWGQGLLPSGTHPGLREQRIPGVGASHNAGGWGKKVSRLNKEPREETPEPRPSRGARLQKPLSQESSPQAFPRRTDCASSEQNRSAGDLGSRKRWGGAAQSVGVRAGVGGRKSSPFSAQTTPVHARFRNGAETRSCQSKIHPKEPPVTKWGRGDAPKNCLQLPRHCTHPISISPLPGAHCPRAEGRTGTAPQAEGWPL